MNRTLQATLLTAVMAIAASTSQAQVFTAHLSGANESPPNASPGTGEAIVTLDTLLNTMRVQVNFSGLTANATASHIHASTATPFTGTAGVATTTPTFAGFPAATSGSYDNTLDLTLSSSYNPAFVTANGGTTASAEAALLKGIFDGKSYLNIHTSNNPTGEIRGFLAAPEPGTMAFLSGMGFFGTLLALRRRRR